MKSWTEEELNDMTADYHAAQAMELINESQYDGLLADERDRKLKEAHVRAMLAVAAAIRDKQ